MTPESQPQPEAERPVDSVLLIDGDNDPHLPPEFRITPHTLARVFLRPQAKMPKGLERKLGHLPMCVPVVSPKGGANAADFVMSLHAGMLHAVLPMSVPFTLVTNDKSLAAMVQELQRIGRMTNLWTSHPDAAAQAEASAETGGRGGRGRRPRRGGRAASAAPARARRGRGRAKPAPAPDAVEKLEAIAAEEAAAEQMEMRAPAPAPSAAGGKSLEAVAATYAARLSRVKDPPSRLKTLLNDIKNRAVSSGFSPEAILEELKRSHGVSVDEQGRVHRS